MSRSLPRSVALVNPLGDFGIDTYTHELARGLAENGVHVDVFTSEISRLKVYVTHRNYRRFRVLGSSLPLVLADSSLRGELARSDPSVEASGVYGSLMPEAPIPVWRNWARKYYLGSELAIYLRRARYDVVWTQWPDFGPYATFWAASRWLRLPIVHTVHNILPHERSPGDIAMCERVYRTARLLFLHSTPVLEELTSLFPAHASKAVTMPFGTFTVYPRRPEGRARVRNAFNIPANAVVLLCCGLIRPYKNVDACIQAMAVIKRKDVILMIAGGEPESPRTDPLAQTRALVRQVGIEDRVRLHPGFLDETGVAELFEAADVLMLPYLKSYGSGLLMLGITFGKYIVATRTGMGESASRYPGTIFLEGSTPDDVRHGIELAVDRVAAGPRSIDRVSPELDWTSIADQCLNEIGRLLPNR